MPTRVSYEPSIQALVAHLFPRNTTIRCRPQALRARVSWPETVRSRGLGRVEGGELILVPPGREDMVLGHLDELAALHVAGVVVERGKAGDDELPAVPVVVVPSVGDVRVLRQEIERYITRRRRELFALDGEMHRALVDAALGGATPARLVRECHARTGHTVLFDRAGERVTAGDRLTLPDRIIDSVEAAAWEVGPGTARALWIPPVLAAPVAAGNTLFGTAVVVGVEDGTIDDDEVALGALTAALAIACARSPVETLPTLEEYLPEVEERTGEALVTVIALTHPSAPERAIARALATELSTRGLPGDVAAEEGVTYAAVPLGTDLLPTLTAAVSRRLSVPGLRAGAGRERRGREVRRSVEEARDALRLGSDLFTPFEAVEVEALLRSARGGAEFVTARLGPLIPREELVRTLASYLRLGRRVADTAAELGTHRNTVVYRVRRVEELLGVDLDDGDTCFALQLALACRELQSRPANEGGRSG